MEAVSFFGFFGQKRFSGQQEKAPNYSESIITYF